MRPPRRAAARALLFLLLSGAGTTAVAAQVPDPPPPAGEGAASTSPEVFVDARPHDPMVGIALRFSSGTAADPEGREGTAFLAALLLEEEGTRRLETRSARVEARAGRDSFLVTALAPTGEWEATWRELMELLDGIGLTEADVLPLRDLQLDRLRFEAGAPGREFERERDFLLLGSTHPGARTARGTSESLQSIQPADPLRFIREHLAAGAATVAVVGAVEPSRVAEVVGRPATAVGPAAAPSRPFLPPATPPGPSAWTTGERLMLDRDITSTWIAVAWPLPPSTPYPLEEFLAHVISEALNPTPPDPGLYGAQVEVVRRDGAPVLLVNATVDPRAALAWENRILGALDQVAEAPPPGAFFELTRRRYRSARLLEQAAPDARARWIAERSAEEGRVPSIASEVWGLSRDGLAALASARGEPRILIFGPVRMMQP